MGLVPQVSRHVSRTIKFHSTLPFVPSWWTACWGCFRSIHLSLRTRGPTLHMPCSSPRWDPCPVVPTRTKTLSSCLSVFPAVYHIPLHSPPSARPSLTPPAPLLADILSGYDFGYLLKILTCEPLPANESDFFHILSIWFPCIYDIKHVVRSVKTLRGGLQEIAESLGVSDGRFGLAGAVGSVRFGSVWLGGVLPGRPRSSARPGVSPRHSRLSVRRSRKGGMSISLRRAWWERTGAGCRRRRRRGCA
jgi:hypothetical protein